MTTSTKPRPRTVKQVRRESNRQPKWMVHKYARRGICANDECKAKLRTGDRIYWESRGVAYCAGCGVIADEAERQAYEFQREMRGESSVAVEW